MKKQIIIIAGPTAVGKTEYAIETAKAINGEIVSADSMQLYKYMDIGSAKPTAEELSQVKHYLVDEIDPREKFSVAQYQKLAKAAIREIFDKGRVPVISGGTGLYINSLMYEMDFAAPPSDEAFRKELEDTALKKGRDYLHSKLAELDPDAAARIHPNNVKKVIRAIEAAQNGNKIKDFNNAQIPAADYDVLLAGLTRDRAELYERINCRVDQMVEEGLVEEARMVYPHKSLNSLNTVGYKEIFKYLDGEWTLPFAIEKIKQNSRIYSRKQMTWFKRDEEIHWFHPEQEGEILEYCHCSIKGV